jgi:CRP-like cAMP-binding protein
MAEAQAPVDLGIHGDNIVRFADGKVIFLKGAGGDHAYVVKSGKVEIREGGRALECVAPGGLFGEMAMIDAGPRSASAVAVGQTDLIVLDRPTFDALVRDVPDFARNVMRLMAKRLRATTADHAPVEDRVTVAGE